MFLLNNTNYKYSNSHFHKALDESGKETFTKEEEQKNKEAELAELGILPKSGIS